MARTALLLVAILVAGCAGPAMPSSSPLRGQTPEAMQQDRADCEQVALNDPSIAGGTSKGGYPTSYWEVGGPNTVTGRLLTRQRHVSFSTCMESRGYKVEREP